MTPLVAATATHTDATPAFLAIAFLIAAAYAIACWLWPFRACARCDGAGKFRSPSGRAWRYCRRCDGKGAQLRLGRRLWNGLNKR
ncbi:hypothetical protein [Actinomadura rubrisoli]|uniref:Uncharacterized protein n=1 Tax=Actinomadura rubrisoli TaxID=2530368 RepID=A0A4R5AS66_9ACTN|nr:hypothetical protein [Actinomadura rubrisoli]TDD75801.1 hypothetical protein E1298_31305 [Actinomadura rubrisoli]